MPAADDRPPSAGTAVGPGTPRTVTAGMRGALLDWLSGVQGVPADPTGSLPTLPAVLALAGSAGSGGPGDLLARLIADSPGTAVVHGDQRLESARAVRPGDRLVLASTVESTRSMGASVLVAVSTAVTDPAGAPVATLRSTFVLTPGGLA